MLIQASRSTYLLRIAKQQLLGSFHQQLQSEIVRLVYVSSLKDTQPSNCKRPSPHQRRVQTLHQQNLQLALAAVYGRGCPMRCC